ncbi:sarcoplasmic calcium-binding protein-like [Lingula anatina]|uniref:Sarcoplasmic calcium-binding protein-like n=1 Tax=Lingula anatina TaxID=7574 RepID=A0A1S3IQK0_LINAN|nr:sarcoplasmic calcium-binding protein-like [Lingula anatina]|eukprot:XP_013399819.1 sarcoplasmic calcium-binding protein-like [Lingula anatina]
MATAPLTEFNEESDVSCRDYLKFELDETCEKAKHVIDKCLHRWVGIAGNKNKITEDEYLQSIHSLTIQSRSRPELYHGFVSGDFKMMDIDDDGIVSKDEHVAFFYGLKVPKQFSNEMFDIMDTDKNGLITFEEFAEGFLEFWLTEDPNNKYNNFYGPLVD